MTDKVTMIDGTIGVKSEGGHPSFSQDLLEEIDELDVVGLDGESSPLDLKPKKEAAKEEDLEEEDILDEEETTEEEEIDGKGEEEPTDEEEDENLKQKPVKEAAEVDESYISELSEISGDLRRAHDQVAMINESRPEAPEKPTTDEDDDPEAWVQYRYDLAAWKTSAKSFEAQATFAKQKVREMAEKQEDLFVANHKGENLSGFKNWIAASIELQALFYTGKKNLESLYKMYKVDIGDEPIRRQVSDMKKKGQKFKAVSSKGGNVDITAGKYPKQFKYINLPQYKDLTKQLLSTPNPFTGKKPSLREVNELIKSEYNYHRGKF